MMMSIVAIQQIILIIIIMWYIYSAHIQRLMTGIDNLINPTPCKFYFVSIITYQKLSW